MLLMTGLMIFNIASLEVSPHQPHPSLYLGIITITAHLLTPQPCLSIIVICQHFSFSAHSILSMTLDSGPFYLDPGREEPGDNWAGNGESELTFLS